MFSFRKTRKSATKKLAVRGLCGVLSSCHFSSNLRCFGYLDLMMANETYHFEIRIRYFVNFRIVLDPKKSQKPVFKEYSVFFLANIG